MKVAILDYGMGNLRSIVNALNYLGNIAPCITKDASEIQSADKVILPGVGYFEAAMKRIHQYNLDSLLQDLVIGPQKPILGICLGMQLMGISSTEGGLNRGLGYINGVVEEFPRGAMKVPHVGANQVTIPANSRLYKGLSPDPDFYFVHSFRMLCSEEVGQAYCFYISPFIASFEADFMAGVQFHPELSQRNGLKLLSNFLKEF